MVTGAAFGKAAAMDPDADGEALMLITRRANHIVVEAVFRDGIPDLISTVADALASILRGGEGGEESGIDTPRGAESQVADRGLGERDAEEEVLIVLGGVQAGDGTILDSNCRVVCRIVGRAWVMRSGNGRSPKQRREQT